MSSPIDISAPVVSRERQTARKAVRGLLWFCDHWVLVFSLFFGVFVVAPFLAPLFMHWGWTGPARLVYTVYSTLCHQMAQRSFFLFGPQPMYNIAQLPVTMTNNDVDNMLALRNFIGNADLGWKVAWSDRMTSMYGGVWLAGILFGLLRQVREIRLLRLPVFLVLLVPMVIDGGTHFLSDINGGLAGGFRYSNQWLANLTGNVLPTWFYAGDALGSFNSWARLISGLLFGFAVVWFAFPYLDRSLQETATVLRLKLAGIRPATK